MFAVRSGYPERERAAWQLQPATPDATKNGVLLTTDSPVPLPSGLPEDQVDSHTSDIYSFYHYRQ